MVSLFSFFIFFSLFLSLFIPLVPLFWFVCRESESSDVFECGFDPFSSFQIPVYIHFFIVGILFLVFDVELVVSLPLVYNSIPLDSWVMVWATFLLILFTGLALEVFIGTLDWKE